VTLDRRVAQLAAVGCFFALAAISIGRTLGTTWDFLTDQHESYADLTAAEPNIVPEFQTLLPVSAVNFFSSRMRRGDRFYVQAAEGPFIAGVDYPTAVRTFGRFQLLPAVLVRDPAEADVVLAIGADPARLGLRLGEVARSPDGRYAIARVER
jgi:hypothetical protein